MLQQQGKKHGAFLWVLFGGVAVFVTVLIIVVTAIFYEQNRSAPSAVSTVATSGSMGISEKVAADGVATPGLALAPEASPAQPGVDLSTQKIIKTANYSFQVDNVDKGVARIEALATQFGGSVLTSSVSAALSTQDQRTGAITVRVPADKFDAFRAEAKKNVKSVDNEQVSATDVTESVIDTKARLEAMKAEEQALLAILTQAKTVDDTLKVRTELSRVRADIESLSAQVKYYDTQTSFSTATFLLTEPAVVKSEGFTPGITWKNAVQSLVNSWKGILQGLIIGGVYIGGILLPVLLVLWVVKKMLRMKKPGSTDSRVPENKK